MGADVWAVVTLSIALVFAGAIAWWIGQDCIVTIIGACGAVLAGAVAVVTLAASVDPTAAMSVALMIIAVGGVWLLGFSIAGGIRWQRRSRPRIQRSPVVGDDLDVEATDARPASQGHVPA